jgi:hypothetical protein
LVCDKSKLCAYKKEKKHYFQEFVIDGIHENEPVNYFAPAILATHCKILSNLNEAIVDKIKKIILSKKFSLILNLHNSHGFYREKNNANKEPFHRNK